MAPEPPVSRTFGTWQVVAIIVGVVLVFWAGRLDFATIDLSEVSLRRLGELLATFLFLALLIERAVELVLNWRFGSEEIGILTPLKQAAARHDAKTQILSHDIELLTNPRDRAALVGDGIMRGAQDVLETLPAQAAATRAQLDELSLRRRHWATWTSMVLSGGLALSGFQVLHGAFAAQIGLSELPNAQAQLFASVDMFLTTVVLAGGAGGVHSVISRLLDFGQKSKTGLLPD